MPILATLSNTCTCQYCEQCECSYSYVDEQECPECEAEMKFHDCYGDCYTDARDDMLSLIEQWQSDAKVDNLVIEAAGMTWRGISATSSPMDNAAKALDSLSINGEYTLRLTRDGDSLSIVRSSHDELGALFTFRAATTDEMENESWD